jgi:hypothetical protein
VAALVDLLVLEPTNPRGLYGVLDRLRAKLVQLPTGATGQARVPLAELLPPASALPSRTLLCASNRGRHPTLGALCDQLGARMAKLSEEIGGRYFSHAGVAPKPTCHERHRHDHAQRAPHHHLPYAWPVELAQQRAVVTPPSYPWQTVGAHRSTSTPRRRTSTCAPTRSATTCCISCSTCRTSRCG